MIFLRCHIRGFGALTDLRVEFEPGLNIVFAPNEGGKTTLQRFLAAILYGQFRADMPLQRRLEPWVESLQPWRAQEYRGAAWVRLRDGRAIELQRAFGRDAGSVQILAATGEEISANYERLRNGEVLFGLHHLGLPKGLFESLAVIRENRAADIQNHDSIRDRIANLVEFGDEEHSVQRCVNLLELGLEEIGSDRAPTRPYRQALDSRDSLQQEERDLEARRAEYAGWMAERARREADVSRLETILREARAVARTARYRESEQRLFMLEELESELVRVGEEIASAGGDPSFPAQHLDDLMELLGARDSLAGRLQEVRSQVAAASARLNAATARRREFERFEAFASGAEGEIAVDLYHQHLGLTVQRDSCQRTVTRLVSERIGLEQALAVLPAPLSDASVDWQQKLVEAAEQEREGARREKEVVERVAAGREESVALRRKASSRRAGGFAAAAAAAILLSAPGLLPLEGWLRYAPLLPSAGAGLAAVSLFRRAGALAASAAARALETRVLEREGARLHEEAGRLRREIDRAMRDSSFESMEEFLDEARKASDARLRLVEFDARIRDAEAQRDKAAADCSDVFASLRDYLSRAGLSCSPGNLPAQMDHFRGSLKRFRDADREHHECSRIVEERTVEAGNLDAEIARIDGRVRAILAEGRVESSEEFRESCRRRQLAIELDHKKNARARELDRLRGPESLDELREKVAHLKEEAASGAGTAGGGGGTALLPYLPSSAEADSEERRAAGELASAREELAAICGRVAEAFQGYRSLPEIEEDLAAAEELVANLELNRAALTEALETVRVLAREQQEVLAPQLNLLVDQRFLRLSGSRYQEVKIDPDLEIRVREKSSGELRSSTVLSRGTQDQVYFALRFGILDLLSRDDEPCPCLLDEPFAAYDRERSVEAFRILAAEAERRQLLLFTCREDVRDLGLSRHGHLIAIGG